MARATPLRGMRVAEIGDRIAVAACGSVLMSLGADVVETDSGGASLSELLSNADVVLHSSDVSPTPRWQRAPSQIVCDVTAYGNSGPMAGVAHDDAFVQALSGLAETTGEPDGPPMIAGFPMLEGITALYAAAGVIAALRMRAQNGRGQDVDVALYDCAFSTLTTFLPFHFIGESVSRGGNKHVLASPWNIYKASDGWLIVCTGTDEQWRRLADVMGRPELAADPRYAKVDGRVAHRQRVDALVQEWVAPRAVTECVQALETQGIASGPIVKASELAREKNIAHRGFIAADDAQGGAFMPSAVRFEARAGNANAAEAPALSSPASDLEVLEIGQYTTAPFVARQLGALGAEVLKVESPEGDGCRGWAPRKDGQGYFFALSNSDKRSLCVDLRKERDRALFVDRLSGADVLVENLKPGSLARLGLAADELARINPRLIYCAISGFGADSAYPGRPAFDTVVQAMSGVMDLNRAGDVPQKVGISLADILGGTFGLIATLAALLVRDRTGSGAYIDISMQDAAAWLTQWTGRGGYRADRYRMIRCADGYVVARCPDLELPLAGKMSRADVVRACEAQSTAAAPVLTVSEVAESAQAKARNLLLETTDSAGRTWPAFRCPIGLTLTPPAVSKAIGRLGEANNELAASCAAQ